MDRGMEIELEYRESLKKLILEWKADPRKGWSRRLDFWEWFDPLATSSLCRNANRPTGTRARFYDTIPRSKMSSIVYGKLHICRSCQNLINARKRSKTA
jgi:hypothetical protein